LNFFEESAEFIVRDSFEDNSDGEGEEGEEGSEELSESLKENQLEDSYGRKTGIQSESGGDSEEDEPSRGKKTGGKCIHSAVINR
jgi:hypothetical protein